MPKSGTPHAFFKYMAFHKKSIKGKEMKKTQFKNLQSTCHYHHVFYIPETLLQCIVCHPLLLLEASAEELYLINASEGVCDKGPGSSS